MNNQTPLIREGLTPMRGKSSFFFKVMLVLAIHVVIIGGLLLQGCIDVSPRNTNVAPPAPEATTPTESPRPAHNIPPEPHTSMPKALASQRLTTPALTPIVAIASTSATPGDTATYTVKPGDTLGKIARMNHTSAEKIKTLNALKTTVIRIGQKLKVPASKVA
jgi:LysM repeat protein